ncbi:sugar ABC transporter permease [Paenibacillus psychroresistens]|uniref:Sugar ABC transporter permease n=2 Tax=Paenibacillus psychroresistens TaxID=1778678 RepID=A0A6B8RUN6_9BACL|nr:sugar ABC transporter permease [Paenibacillus psychroresistens]
MTVPFFVLVLIFSYVPLWGWSIAFFDYSPGVSLFESKFAGFKYFIELFAGDSQFLMVMRNTLVLSFLNLLTTPLPIILAIMIVEVKIGWLRRFIQTISSFPYFVSWIIVYSMFFTFLSVDDGLINQLFFTNRPIDILGDPDWTWALQTFASLWKSMGWTAIIYIAAISNLDQELYHAAQVDGAGRLKQIWHITIPGVMPTFIVILLLTIGNLVSTGFEQYYVFHNPLIHDVIEVLDTYTYRLGLVQLDFSFSTAVGIFKTVVSVLLLFSVNLFSKKVLGRSII